MKIESAEKNQWAIPKLSTTNCANVDEINVVKIKFAEIQVEFSLRKMSERKRKKISASMLMLQWKRFHQIIGCLERVNILSRLR